MAKVTKSQSVYRLRKLRALMRRVPDKKIDMRSVFPERGQPGCMLYHARLARFLPADVTAEYYLGVTSRQGGELYMNWFSDDSPYLGAAGKAEFDRRITKLINFKAA